MKTVLMCLFLAGCGQAPTTATDFAAAQPTTTEVAPAAASKDGAQGSKGDKGDRGPKGDTGDAGADGKAGVNGKDGLAGAIGASGMAGAGGIDGKDGIDGAVGVNGSNGVDGKNGKDGVNGTTGSQGVAGSAGAQGTAGATGATGVQGIAGTTGAQGIQGPSGAALKLIDGSGAEVGDVFWVNDSSGDYWIVNGLMRFQISRTAGTFPLGYLFFAGANCTGEMRATLVNGQFGNVMQNGLTTHPVRMTGKDKGAFTYASRSMATTNCQNTASSINQSWAVDSSPTLPFTYPVSGPEIDNGGN